MSGAAIATDPPSPEAVSAAEIGDRLRSLRDALRAARAGDFAVRLPESDGRDPFAEVAIAFNGLVAENELLTRELERVSRTVRADGRLHERASIGPASGAWAVATDAVNALIDAIAWPTLETTRVLELAAGGDLSESVSLRSDGHAARGDLLRLGSAANTLIGRLRLVTAEVSRVVRAIGTEGRLAWAPTPAISAARGPA